MFKIKVAIRHLFSKKVKKMKKGVDKPRSKWYHKQAPKTRESNRHSRKRRVQKNIEN